MQKTAEAQLIHESLSAMESKLQTDSYLDDWLMLAQQFPLYSERYKRNAQQLETAAKLLHDPNLSDGSERRRVNAAEQFYRRIPQDSRLIGAGEDIETALSLVLGSDREALGSLSEESASIAIAMCDDLQYLTDEVDSRAYNELGLQICNNVIGNDQLGWTDEGKISAAMMWENFKFEELRVAEGNGDDVFEATENAMAQSIGHFSRTANEIFSLPESNRDEVGLKSEKLGFAYEWAMTILWRQKGIEEDDYGHTAIRHANLRQDRGIENNLNGEYKSGNFDSLRMHYGSDGAEESRDYLQVKMGDASDRQYREPIKKVTLDGMSMVNVVDAVRGLAKLYAPLMRDIPGWHRPKYTKADKEKVEKALDSVRIIEASNRSLIESY